MPHTRRHPGWLRLGLFALASGCASRPAAEPVSAEALEQARREERQKVLQQYWSDRTASPAPPAAAPGAWPGISYPAGTYDGLRFGPRQAPDTPLCEPPR